MHAFTRALTHTPAGMHTGTVLVVVLTGDINGNLGTSPFSNVPSQGAENGEERGNWR